MFNPSEAHLLAQLGREQRRALAQRERIADLDATIALAQAAHAEVRRDAEEARAKLHAAEQDIDDLQAVVVAMGRDVAARDATIAQLRAEAGDAQLRYAQAIAAEPARPTLPGWLAWLLP